MRNAIALILGGGRGTRLFPLTKIRSKPAVPLAGKYRLIDIPISNCINSELNRIYVLTQFLSVSLHRHIRQTYSFDNFRGGFVELLAAQQTVDAGTDWYQGTADAVRKNLRYVSQADVEHVVILSGDQLYRMDFRDMMKTHIDNKADVTIAGIPVERKEASALGIMRADDTGRVTGFLEKPQTQEEIDLVRTDPAWIDAQGLPSKGRDCVASMGLYIFNKKFLIDLLEKTDYEDFGKEVFPTAIRTRRVQLHLFDDYWEDIGTIRAFYEANLSLARRDAPFDFSCMQAPVYSRPRFLPPSLMEDARVTGSLIADGCKIGKGAVIENSVIGLRTVIGENVTIRNSVVMGADYTDSKFVEPVSEIPLGIGDNSIVEGSILDKNARIGKNCRIVNDNGVENQGEDEPVQIRDGIPIVIKNAELADGFKLG
ncbi:Glucose-1-phosphate adenylyltransferase [Roseimaritima multifibrata]|uniref:Glucose-1-phosphate adenylyltransferase n=1 Tax=Roseimaritima multifibrata TaxID=1930274 RepID=A0A517MEY6_9BACT|nr:glucose-1-phosphate adenylyltransferase [Roseimaritima multifibrata]QDS93450.1 Glucose-1-phosphate adenylyltransferase [Roseimaritima multifibrata]